MNTIDIVRAWKDAEYRNSLSGAERAALPENPAGVVTLTDEEMDLLIGGGPSNTFLHDTCPAITQDPKGCFDTKTDIVCGGPGKLGIGLPSIPRPAPRPIGR
jgi:mersacidin/lichenicidin family type 2 lantibiotic